jgi:hypothetical protein
MNNINWRSMGVIVKALGKRRWFRVSLVALLAIVMSLMFSRILAPGFDVNRVFYPAVSAVWQGQSAYDRVELFTNPPWTLLALLVFGSFPSAVLHGALVTATLLAMFWVMRDYTRFKVSYPLAVISMPFLAMLWVGQIEAFALAGTLLAYRAVKQRNEWQLALGLLMMLIKPQETWVIVLLIAGGVVQQWRPRRYVKAALLVIGVALASSLLLGFGWLDRILSGPSYAGGWQNFSLWQLSEYVPQVIAVGLWIVIALVTLWSLRRAGLSRMGLAVAAVASNLLSPYLTGPHLLMSLCYGWGLLFDRSIGWGAVAYLFSLTPLLRLTTGNQALNQLDLIFPMVVMAGLIVRQFFAARTPLVHTHEQRLRETG